MCRLFLEENEPVIAKYRNAWYEARIVMVERQAICKIYFKTDPRKTEFTVHLNHLLVAESATHQLRLFIRIQQNDPEEIELIGFRDVSTYTVEPLPPILTKRTNKKKKKKPLLTLIYITTN
ncbi:hypothetical protein CRE_14777 [Caenorhabditis remanei]|uniref:Uncharacterized protein n=1 Tax=Caenorhabditis remanei TaxID=31234 RepID=E3MRN0_CAERE|nr:hypothetical protein CRE_14777 [Caenorhabditis remanei]